MPSPNIPVGAYTVRPSERAVVRADPRFREAGVLLETRNFIPSPAIRREDNGHWYRDDRAAKRAIRRGQTFKPFYKES